MDYNVSYTAIANSDATYLAVNWKPQIEEMYDNAGGDGKFYRQGTYIAGAAQGYLIDKKTAEKYHIRTLDQLRDPKLAKLFDTDGDGKAYITGCNPGWVYGNVIDGQIKGFNLQATVTQNQGNYSSIIADTLARYHQGKPVLYYTWTPYWLSAELVRRDGMSSGCRYRIPSIRAIRIPGFRQAVCRHDLAGRRCECAEPADASGRKYPEGNLPPRG